MAATGAVAVADDRRVDQESRKRVEQLEVSWQHAVARLDARYRLVARLVILGIVITTGFSILGYALLQGERWSASRDDCERTNQRTEAEIGLLTDLQVRESTLRVARRRLPHIADCGAYADGRVGWPRLNLGDRGS